MSKEVFVALIDSGCNFETYEKIAREDLGLVKKGETPIIKSSNN